ncbi:MAG: VOC family protein [Betaproteobacteria bacterium]
MPRLPFTAQLDHLVVAAATLEEGEAFIAARTGATPQRGGKHVAMGTHNSLLRLGERAYLEIIAIDPDAKAPSRPRWFALDRPSMRATLDASPRLITWVARCDDIDAARAACTGASGVDPGTVHPMSRDAWRWRITIPDDGMLPAGGAVPALIEWLDARHPADALPDSGARLATLAAAHPDPASIRTALSALGLGEALQVTYDGTPRVGAMLRTRNGPITL